MDATNRFSLREYVPLRIAGIFIFLIGFLAYATMAWLFYIEVRRNEYAEWIGFVLEFFQYVVLSPGFIPLLVGFRFLVLFRSSQGFFVGLFIFIPVFVIFHYIVAAFSAHDSGWLYLTLQFLEILFFGVICYKFRFF